MNWALAPEGTSEGLRPPNENQHSSTTKGAGTKDPDNCTKNSESLSRLVEVKQ
jgi:hypothetical protein